MSIWATLAGTALGLVIGGPLGALAGAAAGGAVDAMRARATNPERRRVAFSIAAIALAAKMASADGNASAAEFATFQRLFHVDPAEAGNARRFYDLAKGSMAGFQAYAIQAADLLGQGSATLEDLLDALWMIAAVDGFHEAELAFLGEVATILGFDEAAQARIRRRHLAPAADDPWAVLGVEPGAGETLSPRSRAGRGRAVRIHPRLRIAHG
jgi:DnaJ like chaperone protein